MVVKRKAKKKTYPKSGRGMWRNPKWAEGRDFIKFMSGIDPATGRKVTTNRKKKK